MIISADCFQAGKILPLAILSCGYIWKAIGKPFDVYIAGEEVFLILSSPLEEIDRVLVPPFVFTRMSVSEGECA